MEVSENVLCTAIKKVQKNAVRRAIKKKLFFLTFPERGGGLVESKISLTEKTEIFLDFFAERGGVSPNPKGF